MTVLIIGGLVAMVPRLIKKKPIEVKTVRVERATVRDEVSSSTAGEVAPDKKAQVRAELGGRVLTVRRERGDRVKRGEVIVTVDAQDLDARAAQALATQGANQAQVSQAQARVHTIARQVARAKALADKGAGTQQLAEDTALQEQEAEEALKAAQGLVAQAQAAVRVARVARGKAELTAPFDGILTEVYPDPGDQLAPGTPVFDIIDDLRLHVEATIDEADIGRIQLGQAATLKLDALPGKPIAARLAKIAPAVHKDLKGARTLAIDVDVADVAASKAAGLRAGMSCNVDILVAEKPNVASLPSNSIVGRGAKRTVFKVEHGLAKVVPVEIGVSNWDRAEIMSGLAIGDEVVAALNSKELADGVPVTSAAGKKE